MEIGFKVLYCHHKTLDMGCTKLVYLVPDQVQVKEGKEFKRVQFEERGTSNTLFSGKLSTGFQIEMCYCCQSSAHFLFVLTTQKVQMY